MIVESMTIEQRLADADMLLKRMHNVCLHRERVKKMALKNGKEFPIVVPPIRHFSKSDGEYTILEIYHNERERKAKLNLAHAVKQMIDWSTRPMLVMQHNMNLEAFIYEVTPHAMERFRERANMPDATRLDIAVEISVDMNTFAYVIYGKECRNQMHLPKSIVKQAMKHVHPGWEVAFQASRHGVWLCEAYGENYIRLNSFVGNDGLFNAQRKAKEDGRKYADFLDLMITTEEMKDAARHRHKECKYIY